MVTATIFEAKTKLSELVRLVQRGETVVITSGRDRTPVARLEPIAPALKPQRLGLLYDPSVPVPEGAWDALFEPEEVSDNPDDPIHWGKDMSSR